MACFDSISWKINLIWNPEIEVWLVFLWPHLMTLLILWRSERSSWRALSSSLNNSRFDFFFSTCIEMNWISNNYTLTGDGKVLIYRYCHCVLNLKKKKQIQCHQVRKRSPIEWKLTKMESNRKGCQSIDATLMLTHKYSRRIGDKTMIFIWETFRRNRGDWSKNAASIFKWCAKWRLVFIINKHVSNTSLLQWEARFNLQGLHYFGQTEARQLKVRIPGKRESSIALHALRKETMQCELGVG